MDIYLQLNKKPSDVSVYSYTRNAQHLRTTYTTNKADITNTTNTTNKADTTSESSVTNELSTVSTKYLSPYEYNKQNNLTVKSKKFRWRHTDKYIMVPTQVTAKTYYELSDVILHGLIKNCTRDVKKFVVDGIDKKSKMRTPGRFVYCFDVYGMEEREYNKMLKTKVLNPDKSKIIFSTSNEGNINSLGFPWKVYHVETIPQMGIMKELRPWRKELDPTYKCNCSSITIDANHKIFDVFFY